MQGDCITPEHVFETLEEDLEVRAEWAWSAPGNHALGAGACGAGAGAFLGLGVWPAPCPCAMPQLLLCLARAGGRRQHHTASSTPAHLSPPQAADLVMWIGISFEQSASVEYFRRVRSILASQGRLEAVQQVGASASLGPGQTGQALRCRVAECGTCTHADVEWVWVIAVVGPHARVRLSGYWVSRINVHLQHVSGSIHPPHAAQAIINPSDDAYFNILSSVCNVEELRVMDVRAQVSHPGLMES